jgi:hypothetical protein
MAASVAASLLQSKRSAIAEHHMATTIDIATMGIGAASVPLIGCPRFLAAPEMEGQNGSEIRPATSVDRPSVGDLRPRRVQAASKGFRVLADFR